MAHPPGASWRCRPLELDTDGIWCCLPGSFPEEFAFKAADGSKTHKVNYPGLMLNVMCAEHNANPQYHTLETHADGSKSYSVSSRMSIEFEVDGPYLVRSLPPPLHLDECPCDELIHLQPCFATCLGLVVPWYSTLIHHSPPTSVSGGV